MSNHSNTEEIGKKSSWENVEGVVSEFARLTQEAVNKQIGRFIAPLTRQIEELIRLVRGTANPQHPNFYHRTELDATSGTDLVEFEPC